MAMFKGFCNAFSKATGLSANDDKIREHKRLLRELNQREDDLKKLDAILSNLQTEYTRYKHRIFYIRYGRMKRMIKSTVEQKRQLFDDIQNKSMESEVEDQGGAMAFAEIARKVEAQEKYYAELPRDQLDIDLRNFPAIIQQVKEELSEKRTILEQLETDYQTSKSMLYPNRYMDMKRMIKKTFPAPAPVLEDSALHQ